MAPFPLLILLLLPAVFFAPAFSDQLGRRILHQPFVPEGSQPPHPSPPPPPPASPDIPFTPATNSSPFFPVIPSPPPPSPASYASFPANISSLTLPENSKSRPANKKLVPAAIAAVIAAVIVVSIAVALHLRRRRRGRRSTSGSDAKTQRSDTTVRPSYSGTGGIPSIPKLQRPSQTSSEFLYLGTLVNSHGAIDGSVIQQQNPRASSTADGSSAGTSRKFDSPELRPLPPLAVHSLRRYNRNGDVGLSADDDAEEFYSPRGSLGGRSSTGTGSASRREFPGVEVEKLVHSSSTSSSSSTSGSDSPTRSASLSISPPASRSPKISRPKSPELVALQSVPPPPPSRPPPPPLPLYSVQWAPRHPSTHSPSPSSSPSPSPPSSSSPERVYSRSRESSPIFLGSPMAIRIPPALPPAPPVSIPPPPPPPPPPGKYWESQRTPSPAVIKMANKPPPLVTSLKPMSLETPNLISPMQLPGNPEPHENDVNDDDDTFELRNLSNGEETPKPKLKPLHWDKVRASSDREMVWDQLKSSSFKLNEEMIETLFVANQPAPSSTENTRRPVLPSPTQENRVLDPKKSQNISILLRAVNVTVDEVCEALIEGNADNLGTELLESLLKMAPTKEEERKLKEYKDDSPIKLGPAEKFLKALLDIPSAFKRVDAMLYISNFESEIEYLKRSFDTLEAACEELRSSRMFLKLLEAVLKTGNRMNVGTNRGDAHAFKLDTLLKLVDVKGADGKTTLLHFVVQEIIRSEGARHGNANQDQTPAVNDDVKCRRLGLQVVSGLSSDLTNVKKAAAMDSEVLNSEVQKLSIGIGKIAEVARSIEESNSGSDSFAKSMNSFMKTAEEEIIRIQAQESVALTLVKEITEYFHGNSAKEEAHPFRIFMVVRDFLAILDRVCKEVGMINERTIVSSAHRFPVPVNPNLQPDSGAGFGGRHQNSSSDVDDSF